MKNHNRFYPLLLTLPLMIFSAIANAETLDQNTLLKLSEVEKYDQRISLGLTAKEQAEFLSEMREMLASIQGVITGIGTNDRDLIMKSAQKSGNRMARATPDSVKAKTPDSFKQIGGPTHMMFEELVIRAETDDMDILARLTGRLMQNCLACHATFKID